MRFTYHRGLAPVFWTLLGASFLELVVVHLLVTVLWNGRAAVLVSAVSSAGILWLVRVVVSFAQRPIRIERDGLYVFAGVLLDVRLPWGGIADVRVVTDAGPLKRPGFLKASLLAYPNLLIDLAEPVAVGGLGRGRSYRTIGLRPDDASGLAQAIRAAKASGR